MTDNHDVTVKIIPTYFDRSNQLIVLVTKTDDGKRLTIAGDKDRIPMLAVERTLNEQFGKTADSRWMITNVIRRGEEGRRIRTPIYVWHFDTKDIELVKMMYPKIRAMTLDELCSMDPEDHSKILHDVVTLASQQIVNCALRLARPLMGRRNCY